MTDKQFSAMSVQGKVMQYNGRLQSQTSLHGLPNNCQASTTKKQAAEASGREKRTRSRKEQDHE